METGTVKLPKALANMSWMVILTICHLSRINISF